MVFSAMLIKWTEWGLVIGNDSTAKVSVVKVDYKEDRVGDRYTLILWIWSLLLGPISLFSTLPVVSNSC